MLSNTYFRKKKIYKFTGNKLCRDHLIEQIKKQGIKGDFQELDDATYISELKKKLVEESEEVNEETVREDVIEEMGDVLEVFNALKKAMNITDQEIEAARLKKLSQNGGFEKRYYISTFNVEEDSPRLAYFRKAPHKYPEIK